MAGSNAAFLIVDDNEDNRYTLTRRLLREGYHDVTQASSGREALELVATRNFDLVLLDVLMPEMNGYQVLERLRADGSLQDLPIVMISALDEIDSVIRCIELGAEDYLNKPFNPVLLRARIGALLEKKRLRDQARRNLTRLEQEMDAARTLQIGMLPREFPQYSDRQPITVHAVMQPAREVGGDLYDCFHTDDGKFCFLVGDVSGKGASAAMFMARTRSLVRITVRLWEDWRAEEIAPASVTEAVNRELCQNNDDRMFVTLFLGILDTRTGVLSFVNAGHPSPYLLRDGQVRQLKSMPGVPLGVRTNTRYTGQQVAFEPGDAVFVCSDGVFEALNKCGELFSLPRLDQELAAVADAAPAEIIQSIRDAVDNFTVDTPKADDLTALAVRWAPVAGAIGQAGL